jgi:polysaccharide biosynthesis/export protein
LSSSFWLAAPSNSAEAAELTHTGSSPTFTAMFVRTCMVLSLVLASASRAPAQPYPDPTQPVTNGSKSGGDTRIPITSSKSEVLGVENSGASSTPAPIALEQPVDPDKYICGPGDVFELNFWGQQNFRLRISADLEGRVFITKVGYVDVAGKTLTDVRSQVKKKVKDTYPGLKFDLVLISPRTFVVHVVDFVKDPGAYLANPLERVSNVVARAGTATGSRRRIAITHRNGSKATADLLLYELTGNTAHNPFLLDGDIISVPFPDVTVAISGAVKRPGTYELAESKDLEELLRISGGFTTGVARTLPVRVIKRNDKQQNAFRDLPFVADAAPKNEPLQDGDKVVVRGIDELQRSVLLIGAVTGADPLDAAASSKRLPYVEGDTVQSLLERAGGVRAPGDLRRSYISRPTGSGPPQVIPVDLDALLVRRDFTADKRIAMNDTIVVPPMRYSVLVEGAVGRAGVYGYNPLFGIKEYIAHAGGMTRTARGLDDVKIIDADGHSHRYSKDLKPSPGDAILVPERNFTRAEVVQIVIASAGLLVSAVAITYAATR